MKNRKKSGQSMIEYIIVVAVIAVAALAIFGVFGDTLRGKLGGAVNEIGGDQQAVDSALQTGSEEFVQDL